MQRSSKSFFIILLILIQSLLISIPVNYQNDEVIENKDLKPLRISYFRGPGNYTKIENTNFTYRQAIYRNDSKISHGFYSQASRIYLNMSANETNIEAGLDRIINFKDCQDFRMNMICRMLYFDRDNTVLSSEIKNKIEDAMFKAKYWYTEPSEDDCIFWTENHQILYHTSELLMGQLYPDINFTNSGMNGTEHINHALPMIDRWLDWRGEFGFSEWHSNTYLSEDIAALVNLVDFCEDENIKTRAAMVLDLIAFGFANQYFKSRYATTHGRAYDSSKVGTSLSDPAGRDSTSEAAWIMLGVGYHDPNNRNSMSAVSLATSTTYSPPPILELIAENSSDYYEGWERSGMKISDAPKYDIGYDEKFWMFWLGMSAPISAQTIETTLSIQNTYDLKGEIIYGPEIIIDLFKFFSTLRGLTLSQYCDLAKAITQGVSLEAPNIYTYRTPYYQLSGVQDYNQKGMMSMQKHIWQATLDEQAFVYTNCPEAIGQGPQDFMGGWTPRSTFYKNIGIIQYDRNAMPLEVELVDAILNMFIGIRFYTHAYFPKWAFDEVRQDGKWIFGSKGDGYIGLYSYKTPYWIKDYELRVNSRKNAWIVELGSAEEWGSFEHFISNISQAELNINPLSLGYDIHYESPSQGKIEVNWDSPLLINDKTINIGSYLRYNNSYCYSEYANQNITIQFDSQILNLDFINGNRSYIV
ncbi:MAG: hypothetical protein GF329_22400 [Candidatus Lokiarchaeota archaeon]|nr:hypothetical protein [Candidatus Lokiarchaeota archaeon]